MVNIHEAAKDIFWIGGSDRRLALFENLFPLPDGVTYNSYIVKDEKTVLFDTADVSVADQYFENLEAALEGKAPDYLVILHMEPDHCALISQVVKLYPNVTLVGGAKTFTLLGQFFPGLDGANKLVVKNFVFNKVGGDKETQKTIEAFAPIGKGTEYYGSEAYPWETFNGTDEDNERGVGTIWTADGSLFYRIDDGGTVDWHNKLICPITLPADSYFIVEIKAKADKPVSCGFFLNPQGGWDPRVSEGIDFTTEEQTFTFETTDTFIMDMGCELLFQFGSEATANLGGVTIEFTSITIYQRSVL